MGTRGNSQNDQWPFQETKLEVPNIYIYIYKAYGRAMQGDMIYPQNMVLYGTVPPF